MALELTVVIRAREELTKVAQQAAAAVKSFATTAGQDVGKVGAAGQVSAAAFAEAWKQVAAGVKESAGETAESFDRTRETTTKLIEGVKALHDVWMTSGKAATDGATATSEAMAATGAKTESMLAALKGGASDAGGALGKLATDFLTSEAGAAALSGGVATLITVFGAGVKAALEFDESLQGLHATTMASAQELEVLREAAIKMSSESTLSFTQVVQAMEAVAQQRPELAASGAALAEMTEQVVKLSEATGTDLRQSTKVTTEVLGQFGLTADDAGRVVNVLAAASAKGAASVEQIGAILARTGTAAHGAGLSFEETAAALEILANSHIPTYRAGNALIEVLLKLQSGAQETNPAIVGLGTALDNLAKQQLSAADIAAKFGQTAVPVVQALLAQREQFRALVPAITDTTAAEDQARIRTDTLADTQQKLRNSIVDLAAAWGQPFVDTIKAADRTLADFAAQQAQTANSLARGPQSIAQFDAAIEQLQQRLAQVQAAPGIPALGAITPGVNTGELEKQIAALQQQRAALLAGQDAVEQYNTAQKALTAQQARTNIAAGEVNRILGTDFVKAAQAALEHSRDLARVGVQTEQGFKVASLAANELALREREAADGAIILARGLSQITTQALARDFRQLADAVRASLEGAKALVIDFQHETVTLAQQIASYGTRAERQAADIAAIRDKASQEAQKTGTQTADQLREIDARLKEIAETQAGLKTLQEAPRITIPVEVKFEGTGPLANLGKPGAGPVILPPIEQPVKFTGAGPTSTDPQALQAEKQVLETKRAELLVGRDQVQNLDQQKADLAVAARQYSDIKTTADQALQTQNAGLTTRESELRTLLEQAHSEEKVAQTQDQREAILRNVQSLEDQLKAVSADKLRNEIASLENLQKQAAAIQVISRDAQGKPITISVRLSGAIEDLQHIIDLRRQELTAAEQVTTQETKDNAILATRQQDNARLLQNAVQQAATDANAAKAQIDQHTQILQLGLQEETSVTVRQSIQHAIIDDARKKLAIDTQSLQTQIALNQAALQNNQLAAPAREQAERNLRAEQAQLATLAGQNAVLDKQDEHVKQLGQDTAQVGRDLESALGDLGSGLIFGKATDAFKSFRDSGVNILKEIFTSTLKNKLGFEEAVNRNLFTDKDGLVHSFTTAFGLIKDTGDKTLPKVADSAKQAADEVGPPFEAAAKQVGDSAQTAQSGWATFFSFLEDTGKSVFDKLVSFAEGFLKLLGSGGSSIVGGLTNLATWVGGLFSGGGGAAGVAAAAQGGAGGGAGGAIITGGNLLGASGFIAKQLAGALSATPLGSTMSTISSTLTNLVSVIGPILSLAGGIFGLVKGGGGFLGTALSGIGVLGGIQGLTGAAVSAFPALVGPGAIFGPGTAASPLLTALANIFGANIAGPTVGAAGIASQIPVIGPVLDALVSAIQSAISAITGVVGGLGGGALGGAPAAAAAGAAGGGVAGAAAGAGIGAALAGSALGALGLQHLLAAGDEGKIVGMTGKASLAQGASLGIVAGPQLLAAGNTTAGLATLLISIIGGPIGEIINKVLVSVGIDLFGLTETVTEHLRHVFADQVKEATGKTIQGTTLKASARTFFGGGVGTGTALDVLGGAAVGALSTRGTAPSLEQLRGEFTGALGNLLPTKKPAEEVDAAFRKLTTQLYGGMLPTLQLWNTYLKDSTALTKGDITDKQFLKRVSAAGDFGKKFQPDIPESVGINLATIFEKAVTAKGIDVKQIREAIEGPLLDAMAKGQGPTQKELRQLGDRMTLTVAAIGKVTGDPKKAAADAAALVAANPEITARQVQRALIEKENLTPTRQLVTAAGLKPEDVSQSLLDALEKFVGRQERPRRELTEPEKKQRDLRDQIAADLLGVVRTIHDAMTQLAATIAGTPLLGQVKASADALERVKTRFTQIERDIPQAKGKRREQMTQELAQLEQQAAQATAQWADAVSQLIDQLKSTERSISDFTIKSREQQDALTGANNTAEVYNQALTDNGVLYLHLAASGGSAAAQLDAVNRQMDLLSQKAQAQIQDIRDTVAMYEKEIAAEAKVLTDRQKVLDAQAEDIQEQIQQKQYLIEDAQARLADKQALIDAKQALIDSAQARLDEKQELIDHKQRLIEDTQARLDEKQAIIDTKQTRLQDLAVRRQELQDRVDVISAMAGMVDSLKQQRDALQGSVAGGGFRQLAITRQQLGEALGAFQQAKPEDQAKAAAEVQRLAQLSVEQGGKLFAAGSRDAVRVQQQALDATEQVYEVAQKAADEQKDLLDKIKTIDDESKGLQKDIYDVQVAMRADQQLIKDYNKDIRDIQVSMRPDQDLIKGYQKDIRDIQTDMKADQDLIKQYNKDIYDLNVQMRPITEEQRDIQKRLKELDEARAVLEYNATIAIDSINQKLAAQLAVWANKVVPLLQAQAGAIRQELSDILPAGTDIDALMNDPASLQAFLARAQLESMQNIEDYVEAIAALLKVPAVTHHHHHAAAGAVITGPTELQAGEAGPEAFIPLTDPRARQFLESMQSPAAEAVGDQTRQLVELAAAQDKRLADLNVRTERLIALTQQGLKGVTRDSASAADVAMQQQQQTMVDQQQKGLQTTRELRDLVRQQATDTQRLRVLGEGTARLDYVSTLTITSMNRHLVLDVLPILRSQVAAVDRLVATTEKGVLPILQRQLAAAEAGPKTHAAQGAIVTQRTFLEAGEAGPEAVIPLRDARARRWLRAIEGRAEQPVQQTTTINISPTIVVPAARTPQEAQLYGRTAATEFGRQLQREYPGLVRRVGGQR